MLPAIGLWSVEQAGLALSPIVAITAAALFSLALATAGTSFWSRRSPAGDLVFGDLMLWRLVRRRRAEKRIASAQKLLTGADNDSGSASPREVATLIEGLAGRLEARDAYTHGHSNRVARFAEAIAKGMKLSSAEIAKVRVAGAVHDVGKINTPREILTKPGRLTDEEFDVIKLHPIDSETLVAQLKDAGLSAIVRHHHERIDGGGYPDGLSGDAIPLGARIIAVADTFDAITSSRPYRKGRKHADALEILRKEAGKQLDSDAVESFLSYYGARRSIAGLGALTAGAPRVVAAVKGAFDGTVAGPIGNGVAVASAAAVLTGAAVVPATHNGTHAGERSEGAAAAAVASESVAVTEGTASDRSVRAHEHRADSEVRAQGSTKDTSSATETERQSSTQQPSWQAPSSAGDSGSSGEPESGPAPVVEAPVPEVKVDTPDLPVVGKPNVSIPGVLNLNGQ
ncbi:MAG: HD-GYP domain-containing protein [Solirubrobacterales bacterium]